jgi:hypothetical protein
MRNNHGRKEGALFRFCLPTTEPEFPKTKIRLRTNRTSSSGRRCSTFEGDRSQKALCSTRFSNSKVFLAVCKNLPQHSYKLTGNPSPLLTPPKLLESRADLVERWQVHISKARRPALIRVDGF